MLEFFRRLFSTEFMPHGMCLYWEPTVLWLNVLSDCLIAVSYYAIPFLLFKFLRRRRDVLFKGLLVAFGVFILACGTTHVLGAVTMWHPVYRLDGVVKAITALASVSTVILMVPLIPALVRLPSPSELARVNASLAREIEERRAAEDEVRRINEELEERVARRTAERHALEEKLMHSQKMEAIGRLAGGVAHDFNNLLTVIIGYSEMIREECQRDPAAPDYATEITHAAGRASALTNQLLTFSRRQVAQPRVINLNDVVRHIERMLGRIIGEDLQLETRLAGGLPPVKVDPNHLDQVIMNLAVNARDAMPHGGRLIIETTETEFDPRDASGNGGRYVLLAISDTGVGMDATTKARLFEPFFTTKEQGKGTGLGLSIVYGIVKQNGGEILVYSEQGQGTVFKIYLPAVSAEPEVLAPPAESANQKAGSETILLVEDEHQVRTLARAMLAARGYQILEAASGPDALHLLENHDGGLHLLLADVVMPGMSGEQLAAKVRAVRPGVRLLLMSGFMGAHVVEPELLQSETPFIRKPFTAALLHRKVREVLDS
jgi:signal transduction histidine kinase/CheY-like chemotaxis protein